MMNKVRSIQERGLILLLGGAVIASGLLVFTDLPRFSPVSLMLTEIRLDNVHVLIPQFVEVEPIDINRAALGDLITLSGIGPALAQRIIDYRTEHGPFQSVEQLENVSGIGPQTIQGLLEEAVVSMERPESDSDGP